MIPRTFPSSVASLNGATQMIVYFLPSVTGLTRWVDYIPVQYSTVNTSTTENTYNQDGYIPVTSLSDITGMTPFKEYVPVYIDTAATDVWKVNITGFIPVGTAGIGGSALSLNFAGMSTLDPRITFSRTSNATLTGSDGLIQYAPHNLLTYSEQFDNAAWAKANTTVTANATTAPDGTLTADTLTCAANSAAHEVYQNNTLVSGSQYVMSVFAKKNTHDFIQLRHYSAVGGATRYANFNLATGALGTVGADATASITDFGNGWYRCVMIATPTSTAGGMDLWIIPASTSSSNTSFTAAGTESVYLWGAQLNVGALQDYNPTTVKNLLGYTQEFDNAAWTKSNSFVQTNLLTYSQDFDNAAWANAKTALTVTANTTVAPDGTSTADSWNGDGTSAYHYSGQAITLLSTSTYVLSFYAKANGVNYVQVILGGTLGYANFDITSGAGAVGTSAAPFSSLAVQDVGNGWYRCSCVITNSASSNIYFGLSNSASATRAAATFATSSGIYIWGAQLAQGTLAGDYQTTYGAAAAVQYTAPDGSLSANQVTLSAGTVSKYVAQTVTPLSTVHTFNVYAKTATQQFIQILNSGAAAFYANFDISTGVVGNTGASTTASITSVGNGWYRLSVTFTGAAMGTGWRIYAADSLSNGYAPTTSSTNEFYIWGAQLSDSASVDSYVYNPVAAPTAAAYYGPRFDYDPMTLAPKGLLIEEQRTNLVLNSDTLATQNVPVSAVAHTLSFYGTGTVTLSGVSTAGPLVGTGAYPNRVTLTFTPTAGTLTLTVTGSVRYAQLEAGAFATSYIPTVASQVTRVADFAQMLGANFSNWYNQSAGTMYAEASTFAYDTSRILFEVGDGTLSNRTTLSRAGATTTGSGTVTAGGANQASLTIANAFPANAYGKEAIAYAVNDFAFVANGSNAATDTSGTVPVVDRAQIGTTTTANTAVIWNGWVKRIAYYNRRLANNELQGITT